MRRRDIPVASITRVTPPRPSARASVAAQIRAVRSFSSGINVMYFSSIVRTIGSSMTSPNVDQNDLS